MTNRVILIVFAIVAILVSGCAKNDAERYSDAVAKTGANSGDVPIDEAMLSEAVDYYMNTGDTVMAVTTTCSLAKQIFNSGNVDDAYEVVDKCLEYVGNNKKYRTKLLNEKIDIAWALRDFERVLPCIDTIIAGEEGKKERFDAVYRKMGVVFFCGNTETALSLCDSIRQSDIMPEYGTEEWQSFNSDYAEILDENRKSQQAIEILQKVIESHSKLSSAEKMGYYLSLAKFHLNIHDYQGCQRYLSAIDSMDVRGLDLGVRNYINILKACHEMQISGHLPSMEMLNAAFEADNSINRYRKEKVLALQQVDELEADKYKLIASRQRLLIVAMLIVIVSIAVIGQLYYISSRRRQRLVEAEERIETLKGMLNAVECMPKNDKTGLLKKVMLQQLGIIKTFAGTPTGQNQEALKKIAAIGSGGDVMALIDWNGLYSIIDELWDGFHVKLLQIYPGIFSEKEEQIICLMKAEFSTKEISVLTQQSSGLIYVRKTAIRHKLNITEKGDIVEFLNERLED